MNLNKLATIVALLLFLCVVVIVKQAITQNNLRAELQIRNIDLKKKNKQLELHQDSLKRARIFITHQDSVWSRQVKEQYELLVIERNKVNHYKTKYENFKNAPVPSYTNSQLDSLLSAITGYH